MIWTDVVQMFLYVGGAMLSFFVILHQIPGGWHHVLTLRGRCMSLAPANFRFSISRSRSRPHFSRRTYSFWAGLIGGCLLTTASHGPNS